MKGRRSRPEVEFIRLFFPLEREAKVAVGVAQMLAELVGDRISDLRPDSLLIEVAGWVENSMPAVELLLVMEEELGVDFGENLDITTFRELVEYLANDRRNL